MMPPEVLSILANFPLALAAIVGLAMLALIPKRARLLVTLGLALVLGYAVWNFLHQGAILVNFVPSELLTIMFFVSYAAMAVGFVLLILAATTRPTHASQVASPGQPPSPPTPHRQPVAPSSPTTPNPGGAGSHPGT